MTDVALVFLQQTIVVVISLGVAADVDLRLHTPTDQLFDGVHHDEVDDEDAGDGRGRPDPMGKPLDTHGGIAVDPAIVDDQVGDIGQTLPRGVSGRPTAGLVEIGDGHGLETTGLAFEHHFDGHRIAPPVGGHDQEIVGLDRILIQDGLGPALFPLQVGRLDGIEVHHERLLENRHGPSEMPRTVEDFLGHHVGVTGAERVQEPVAGQ